MIESPEISGKNSPGKQDSRGGGKKQGQRVSQSRNKNKGRHPVKSEGTTVNKKELPYTKIGYVVALLFIVGFIIVLASGTFDSPGITQNVTSAPQEHNHDGASLANLEELKKLEETVKSNPENYTALLQLAHLYNDSRLYQKAIERYKVYLNKRPNEPDVLVDLGVCYYGLQDFKNADFYMKKGLSIDPRHQIGHFNLGIINLAQNNIEEAKSWWQKTININPNTDIAKKAKELLESN